MIFTELLSLIYRNYYLILVKKINSLKVQEQNYFKIIFVVSYTYYTFIHNLKRTYCGTILSRNYVFC